MGSYFLKVPQGFRSVESVSSFCFELSAISLISFPPVVQKLGIFYTCLVLPAIIMSIQSFVFLCL